MISLDYLFALPILSGAFILLFSSISGSQGQLLSQAENASTEFNAIRASQSLVQQLDAGNYTAAAQTLVHVPQASLANMSNLGICANALEMCRLVTIQNITRLLVLRYANPDKH